MLKNKINQLQSKSLEEIAKTKKGSKIGCLIEFFIIIIGVSLAIYYWFFGEIIIGYKTISPFWGGVIFIVASIILLFIISCIEDAIFSEYNSIIDKANDTILEKIKNAEVESDEIIRLHKEYVERFMGTDRFNQEEYMWHSSHYCWGCGKKHEVEPINYSAFKHRSNTWKENRKWYTHIHSELEYVPLCPDCFDRLTLRDAQSEEYSEKIEKVVNYLNFIIPILLSFIITLFDPSFSPEDWWVPLIWAVLIYGACVSLGAPIVAVIAVILVTPFDHFDPKLGKTKWNFNNIPKFKEFSEKDLYH